MFLLRAGVTLALIQMVFSNEPTANYPTAHQEHIEVEEVSEEAEMQAYFETFEGMTNLLCVFAEAGNQGYIGMRKVEAVIINRTDSELFPDTIEGVCKQKYQFSSYPYGWEKWKIKALESDECKRAIWDEMHERSDTRIMFFRTGYYSAYGTPAYKYKDHYFSYL